VHQIMGVSAPVAVAGWGRRYLLRDGGDTPDTLQITYEYSNFILSYEASMVNDHGVGGRTKGMKYYLARTRDDRPHGMAFYGTNGTLYADRIGFEIYPEPRGESGPGAVGAVKGDSEGYRMERNQMAGSDATAEHVRNFIDCVRTRQKPVADVEIGFHSTVVPLLGNIAIRTRHKLQWDSSRAAIVDDPAASAYLARKARHPWNLISL
ncbi:MAG: hypothetical protein ACRD3O_14350, partial [Terriglobia bacterium]